MVVSFVLLFLLGACVVNGGPVTIDPRFQLSFDGFVMFLKELSSLRSRFQKVKEIGRALSSRIDNLETAILKTTITVGNATEKMAKVTDKTRYLDIQMVNITSVVNEAKNKMLALQTALNTTNLSEARFNLTRLADETERHLQGLLDVTDNLTSYVHDVNITAQGLHSEKESLEEQLAGTSNATKRIEMMGCDTGFSYDNSGLYKKATTIHYPRPFNATPSVIYSLTRLDTTVPRTNSFNYNSRYDYNLNVTLTNVNNVGLSVNVYKDSYSQIRLSEVSWMTCYI